jgi:magnesium-protoporphyrin O-methyltransferase
MPRCSQCAGIEEEFDAKRAVRRLRLLRHRGPDPTTRMLIDDLRAALPAQSGDTRRPTLLLDIGGGVGAVHHELLELGVDRAVHVDASSAYLAAAREEAARVGHTDRVEFLRGDFVEVADRVPPADVVTLDRVICCYHDMPRLVARSAERALSLYGAVYPREGWWTRAGLAVENAYQRLVRSAFRAFLHEPREIDAVLRSQGLERRSLRRTLLWEVVVYTR